MIDSFNSLDHMNFVRDDYKDFVSISFDSLELISNSWVEVAKKLVFRKGTEIHKHLVDALQNQHVMSCYDDWKGDDGYIKSLNHLIKCGMYLPSPKSNPNNFYPSI